jgi:hypothetical protein
MRLQPQLLSQKRFDEHLDPLPFGGLITTALKGLDESGIQAAYSDGNLLHLKPFNLNFTFGIRTQNQPRIAEEAEAVEQILRLLRANTMEWLSSAAPEVET